MYSFQIVESAKMHKVEAEVNSKALKLCILSLRILFRFS